MSFTTEVKEDLLKVNNLNPIADKFELEAMLRFGSEVVLGRPMKISFSCNNMAIIRHFIKLCKKFYKIEYEILSRVIKRLDNRTIFTCIINSGANEIIEDLNLIGIESKYRENIFNDEVYLISYLRGAFFVHGSVNDPASKSGHLEISSISETEILLIQKIMNYFELNARISKRKNYLIAYIKAKDTIGDFLYRIGTSSTMNYYENVLITKEIKTNAKRAINLDIANQDKTNDAAIEQLKYIHYLEYNYPLEKLDSKLLMVMKIRKENPESSLSELLGIIHDEYDPYLSKSGLNHRFRKIKEIAKEYAEIRKEKIK